MLNPLPAVENTESILDNELGIVAAVSISKESCCRWKISRRRGLIATCLLLFSCAWATAGEGEGDLEWTAAAADTDTAGERDGPGAAEDTDKWR